MDRARKNPIVFLMLLAGAMKVLPLHAQEQAPKLHGIPAEVRFLAVGIADGRQKLRCGEAVIKETVHTPWEIAPPQREQTAPKPSSDKKKDRETTQIAHWYYKGDNLSMLVEPDSNAPLNPLLSIRLVADEKQAKVLEEYKPSQTQTRKSLEVASSGLPNVRRRGVVTSPEKELQEGLWQGQEFLDPRFYAYSFGGRNLDQLLLDTKLKPEYKGEEIVDGSRCMKAEIQLPEQRSGRYWFDVEHNFLLRRFEEHQRVGKQIVLTYELFVSRIQDSEGVWMPSLIEIKRYEHWLKALPQGVRKEDVTDTPVVVNSDRLSNQGDYITPPPETSQITISNFSTDCTFPTFIFTLDWPPGTRVYDAFTNKEFTVDSQPTVQKGHRE